MKILIIYEEVPENTKFYSLFDVDQEDWEWMRLCHGKFVNAVNSKADNLLLGQLDVMLEGMVTFPYTKESPIPGDYDYIIHTGVIL